MEKLLEVHRYVISLLRLQINRNWYLPIQDNHPAAIRSAIHFFSLLCSLSLYDESFFNISHVLYHIPNSFFNSSTTSYGKHSAQPSSSSKILTILPASSIPFLLWRCSPILTAFPKSLATHT